MKFSRIRLLGFKSFVDPGEFVIESGLTGIVGPNGCGKSNLVEALRWVMGESSYKNMRASGMDDVIFSGSATRPSRNTAEVTLFLDNADRTAPSAFNDADELQVSRRIEREAGSVYRINGKEARAKDVQLLFADQSTGARSPSMVGQGRIGELIQAKPQARRALLEEAAGISGLHSRRHEAELRLRAAEQNLERLEDVVGELQSQIESLKRQARQAARFKNLSADIRQTDAALLHVKWVHAKQHEGEASSALAVATSLVGKRASQQMNAAKEQAVGAHKLPELREAEAAAAAALQRLTIARTQLDEEAERVRGRADELGRRLAQLDKDIERERQMLRDNDDVLARLVAEEDELRTVSEDADEQQHLLQVAQQDAAARLANAESTLSELTARRADAAATRNQLERSQREANERYAKANRQLADVVRELDGLAEKLRSLPDVAGKKLEAERAGAALSQAELAVNEAEAQAATARETETRLRPALQDARSALQRIQTEASTLAKILAAGSSGAFAGVVDELRVEKGFETALGAALGEDIDVPLNEAAPAHWGAPLSADGDPALPEGVRSLGEMVQAPAQLGRRLAQIGVIAKEDGARLREHLKPGQQLVTREGAVWRWDGFYASAEAPTAAAQRLAQKNRLIELEREAEISKASLQRAEADIRQAEHSVKQATDNERSARDAARSAQRARAEAQDAFARAERAAGEVASRKSALEDTHARLTEGLDDTRAQLVSAQEALREAPDPDALGAEMEAATLAVASERTVFGDARAALDGFRRDRELRQRRLETIARERESWTERARNADTQIAALIERQIETADEFAQLSDSPDEMAARRRTLVHQIEEAEKLRRAAADRLQQAETRQRELDKLATDAIQQLAGAREARVRAEERLTAAEERRVETETRIREALNVEPHLAARQAGLPADGPLPDAGQLESRLERLRVERERLGAVNLRAEVEQQELSERLETIVTERADVIEAIRTLRQAIQSLNREGRDRLLAAFEVVNEQFTRLFTHLFGGGTAELQLIESDDPLQAGLEILARPPGKRPQTMTLLSGGEQALTAMALIFAVFLTNPAPICVLDEVDAPLDDHNVERFCNLMDEMAASTDTRFVIITHNPITMSRMNRLFGVTMAEQGVSQLVSVDLQTAEQMREAS